MVPDAHHRSQTRGRPDDDGQCKRDADDADKGDASAYGDLVRFPGRHFLRCDGVVGCLATGFPGFRGCCRFLPPMRDGRVCLGFLVSRGSCRPVVENGCDGPEPASGSRSGWWFRRRSGRSRVLDGVRGPLVEFRPCAGMVVDLGKKVPVAGVAHEVGKFVRIEPGIDAAHVSFFSVGVSVCR